MSSEKKSIPCFSKEWDLEQLPLVEYETGIKILVKPFAPMEISIGLAPMTP